LLSGTVDVVPGAGAGCGSAVMFSPTDETLGHGVINDSNGVDALGGVVKSMSLWFHPPDAAPNTRGAILTRDAQFEVMPGHFGLGYSTDGRVFLKAQDNAMTTYFLCSAPLAAEWNKIEVRFPASGIQLLVNGALANHSGTIDGDVDCALVLPPNHISMNNNPWVLGADTDQSDEGAANNLHRYLVGARI